MVLAGQRLLFGSSVQPASPLGPASVQNMAGVIGNCRLIIDRGRTVPLPGAGVQCGSSLVLAVIESHAGMPWTGCRSWRRTRAFGKTGVFAGIRHFSYLSLWQPLQPTANTC